MCKCCIVCTTKAFLSSALANLLVLEYLRTAGKSICASLFLAWAGLSAAPLLQCSRNMPNCPFKSCKSLIRTMTTIRPLPHASTLAVRANAHLGFLNLCRLHHSCQSGNIHMAGHFLKAVCKIAEGELALAFLGCVEILLMQDQTVMLLVDSLVLVIVLSSGTPAPARRPLQSSVWHCTSQFKFPSSSWLILQAFCNLNCKQ